jgi:hypothetical protein
MLALGSIKARLAATALYLRRRSSVKGVVDLFAGKTRVLEYILNCLACCIVSTSCYFIAQRFLVVV